MKKHGNVAFEGTFQLDVLFTSDKNDEIRQFLLQAFFMTISKSLNERVYENFPLFHHKIDDIRQINQGRKSILPTYIEY